MVKRALGFDESPQGLWEKRGSKGKEEKDINRRK